MRGPASIFVLFFTLLGCDEPLSTKYCPERVYPALEITVFDAETSQPVLEPLVVTRNGNRVDTLKVYGNHAEGPLDVTGLFDVSVTKDGYADWFREDLLVEKVGCSINTVKIDVLLEGA